MRRSTLVGWLVLLGASGWLTSASALEITGQVRDADGAAVVGAMVKVQSASAGFSAIKVFSDADGRYRVPDLGQGVHGNSVYLQVIKRGYEQADPKSRALTDLAPDISDGIAEVDFTVRATPGVGAQMPASAWLDLAPDSAERRQVQVLCTQCHQMPSDAVKRLARSMKDQPREHRVAAWGAMVKLMRTVGIYGALQAEHAPAMPMEILADPAHSMFSVKDEELVSNWLADNLPTQFEQYPADKVAAFSAPLGTNGKTWLREYSWPDKSFVRETVVIDGKVWVADIARNRLGQLDEATGAFHWYDVPMLGAPAPHTLVPGEQGLIWMTFLGGSGEMAASFDARRHKWRIYDGFPKGLMAHDPSPGPGYRMAFDKDGNGWLTVISHNKVIGFNKDTGEVTPAYDLPLPYDESPVHITVYGGAMTSDGNYWYAQYFGDVGRFNTTTRKVDHRITIPHGDGPHRMVVGDNDTLYISLIGSGQVLIYDAKNLKEIKRVDLPDRGSAPYDVMWDKARNALWMGTVNNDSLLRYNLADDTWQEYPLAIPELNMRVIAIDPESDDLWITNSPIPSTNPQARLLFRFHPGD